MLLEMVQILFPGAAGGYERLSNLICPA